MVNLEEVQNFALPFEKVTEQPHFEKVPFRVNKKIFVPLVERKIQVVVKISNIEQSVFSSFDSSAIYPVTGGWGRHGWTVIDLNKVKHDMLKENNYSLICKCCSKKAW